MYELKFCIDSDGDFDYEHTEYDTEYENIIYFENKNEAFDALKKGYEGILDWFKDFKEELDNLRIDFVDDFDSGKDFGNQFCYFYIRECSCVKVDKGFMYSSSNTASLANRILAQINNNELEPCQFVITKTYDDGYVKEITDILDKYRVEYSTVKVMPGAFNLSRDWISTDYKKSPILCAVDLNGAYPADWNIEDIIKLVKFEEEGKIFIMMYRIEGDKLVPIV